MSIPNFLQLMILVILFPQMIQANCPGDTIPEKKGFGIVYFKDCKLKGYILDINDSSISIIERKYWNVGLMSQQQSIPIEQIELIQRKAVLVFSL